ncbi:hypothetical protein A5678_23785 [Mycobacterium sp. E2733]|nr:hypothetical protein A5678_23785 [Mycobacterium sp. E2733]
MTKVGDDSSPPLCAMLVTSTRTAWSVVQEAQQGTGAPGGALDGKASTEETTIALNKENM